MAFGSVKWFNDAKGFGFIEPEGGGGDVFAHFSQVESTGFKSLAEGENVEFEVENSDKGPRARTRKSTSELARNSPRASDPTSSTSAPANRRAAIAARACGSTSRRLASARRASR